MPPHEKRIIQRIIESQFIAFEKEKQNLWEIMEQQQEKCKEMKSD